MLEIAGVQCKVISQGEINLWLVGKQATFLSSHCYVAVNSTKFQLYKDVGLVLL